MVPGNTMAWRWGVAIIGGWISLVWVGQTTAQAQNDPTAARPITQIISDLQTAHRQFASPLELDDVIQQVGSDPQKLCQWVREQIAYEPYEGFLKGATGTLISQRGNSADKAMLLCELLSKAGFKTELSKGTITAAIAAGALPPLGTDEPGDAELARFAKSASLTPQSLQSILQTGRAERELFLEHLWIRVARDREQISSLLDSARVQPPSAGPSADAEKTHWWVHTSRGELDPTTDSAAALKAVRTFEPDKVPEGEFHRLVVRMFIAKAGEASGTMVLEVPLRSTEVFGRTIAIGASGLDVTKKMAAVPQPDVRAYFDAMESATQFQPALMVLGPPGVPRKVMQGTGFDLQGNKVDTSQSRTAQAGKMGGAVGGMFGGMSGAEPEKPKPQSQLASAWIEIEFVPPGGEPVKIRRDILSPVGVAGAPVTPKQRVLDLLTIREMLVLPEDVSGDYVTSQVLAHSMEWAQYLVKHPKQKFDPRQVLSILNERPHLNEKLFAYGVGRRAALTKLCSGDSATQLGATSYAHVRPTIVSYVNLFLDDAKDPRVARRIDIIENEVRPVGAAAAGASSWRGSFGLACGIMDTALEHVLLSGEANASAMLDQARLGYVRPVVINGTVPAGTTLDATAKAAIEPELARSAFVYLPGPKPMWYRVGLQNGFALGMVEGGGGQEESEYAEMVEIYVQLYEMMEFYSELGRCLGEALTAPLAGEVDAHKVLESCFVGMCAKAPWAAAGVAGVEASWTNLIVTQTINQTFKKFCETIWENLGPGEGGGHGGE